ncbi:MAG: pilus assembly protein CpaE [Chloroflexi bacterium]|nr:pilus assembly protein CpaE [Chloroflexota bacterium]
MISLELALQLKEAGLEWKPAMLDFFALPDRQMDERIFVISDMLVTVDVMQGLQVVAFQGASEWALDSLVTTEAVWIPREEQLRAMLEAALLGAGRPEMRLLAGVGGYRLDFQYENRTLTFEGPNPEELYARGLLYLLRRRGGSPPYSEGDESG